MNAEQIILNAIAQSQVQVSGMTSGGQAGATISIRTESQTISALCYGPIPPGQCTAFLANGQWFAVGAGVQQQIRERNAEFRRRRSAPAPVASAPTAIILYRIRNGDALEHWVRFGDTPVLVKSVPLFGPSQTIQLASNSVDIGSDGIPGLWGGVSFAQVDSAGNFSTTDPQGEATAGYVRGILFPDGILDGGYVAAASKEDTPTASASYSVSSTGQTILYIHERRAMISYEVGGELPIDDINKSRSASLDITYSQIIPSKSWGHVVGGSLYVGVAWGMDENGFMNLEYYAVSTSGAVLEDPPAGTAYKADRDLTGLAFDPTDVNSAAIADITRRDLEFGTHGYAGPGNVRDQYWYLSDEPNFWVSSDTRDAIAAGGTLTLYKIEANNNTESIDVEIDPVAIDSDSGQPTGFDNGFIGDGQELTFDDSFRASYSWLDQITGILRL